MYIPVNNIFILLLRVAMDTIKDLDQAKLFIRWDENCFFSFTLQVEKEFFVILGKFYKPSVVLILCLKAQNKFVPPCYQQDISFQ